MGVSASSRFLSSNLKKNSMTEGVGDIDMSCLVHWFVSDTPEWC